MLLCFGLSYFDDETGNWVVDDAGYDRLSAFGFKKSIAVAQTDNLYTRSRASGLRAYINEDTNAENRRILEVADELHRRCQLYEAQLRDGQDNVIKMAISLLSMPKSQSIKIIDIPRFCPFCGKKIR